MDTFASGDTDEKNNESMIVSEIFKSDAFSQS